MIVFNQILTEQYNHTGNEQIETKWNKLDFKGHPQKMPKLSTKNEFKISSSHIGDTYSKESTNLTDWENFVAKLMNQLVELVHMNESVCCFYVYPHAKISNIAQFSLDIL